MNRKLLRIIGAVFSLLMLFSCIILTAEAGRTDQEPKKTYDIVRSDELTGDEADDEEDTNSDSNSNSGSSSNDDGPIKSNEIFTNDKILGYDIKERDFWEPFKPSNWLKVAMVSDTFFQIFCLLFAVLGLSCFSGSILAFLKSILIMVFALLTNNDPDEAMATVDNETKKTTKFVKGIGTVAFFMCVVCFGMTLII